MAICEHQGSLEGESSHHAEPLVMTQGPPGAHIWWLCSLPPLGALVNCFFLYGVLRTVLTATSTDRFPAAVEMPQLDFNLGKVRLASTQDFNFILCSSLQSKPLPGGRTERVIINYLLMYVINFWRYK